MFGLCKYKDILGVAGDPNRPRILGVRIQDVIFLFVGVFIFCFFTKNNYLKTFIFTLIIMVIAHRIFCVRSATDKLIFPDENNYETYLLLFTLFGILLIYYFRLTPNFVFVGFGNSSDIRKMFEIPSLRS